MSLTDSIESEIKTSMQLKGGVFTLTTIQILNNNLQLLEEELNIKIAQAPNFFNNAPIVIDLCNLCKNNLVFNNNHNENNNEDNTYIDFAVLKHILISKKLIPVGVRNATLLQQQAAIKENLAILRSNTNLESSNKYFISNLNHADNNKIIQGNQVNSNKSELTDTKLLKNKLIHCPVRSGQQIYSPDGDIIVIGSVSNGAELLAEGNIHVYGSLRGRALAGINNNANARIFCNSLEADLISIAGQFKISENIDPKFWKKQVQISLISGKLEITEFL